MRRRTLEDIGGLGQFAHQLDEDNALGEAVRLAGAQVAVPPFAISHACAETSFNSLFVHELRWSRTIRAINPVGHLGSALTHPLAFALLALLLSGAAPWSWPLAAAALAVRLALKLLSERALRQPHRDQWLLPLWDLVSLPIFVASLFSRRVTWRGISFDVDGDGLLSPVRDR